MWIRRHIYALVILAGCMHFALPEVLSATPLVFYKEYTDSAYVDQRTVIHVSSQKANVKINRWDKPMVWMKVTITFDNLSQDIAQKELEYARYNFLKTASEVNFSNYFSLPPGIDKINSKVNVDYQVFVPENVNLIINNEYGTCSMYNITGYLNINNKYGDILLNKVRGRLNVFANLCDVHMNGFSGNLEIDASNSDITLGDINGSAIIKSKNGTVNFEQGEGLDNLKVTSSYSEINVLINDLHRFNYELTARHAKIELGDKFRRFPFRRKSKEKLVHRSEETDRMIEIAASYNTVKLY